MFGVYDSVFKWFSKVFYVMDCFNLEILDLG